MSQTILFLCPHNAAKSVIAAAYCQQLADEYGLFIRADSAGTEPSAQVSPAVVELLRAEGFDVAHHIPQRVTKEALTTATHVVSLGDNVDGLVPPGKVIELWDDVPPPSQDLLAARDSIRAHVDRFMAELNRLTKENRP